MTMEILTTGKSSGAVLRPVERSLDSGWEWFSSARLRRVHGVNGAGF